MNLPIPFPKKNSNIIISSRGGDLQQPQPSTNLGGVTQHHYPTEGGGGFFTPTAGQHFQAAQRHRYSQYSAGAGLAALEEATYENYGHHYRYNSSSPRGLGLTPCKAYVPRGGSPSRGRPTPALPGEGNISYHHGGGYGGGAYSGAGFASYNAYAPHGSINGDRTVSHFDRDPFVDASVVLKQG
ncbi:hypothetical protein NW768_009016 [Fusarium equiseti]|uniref:Uncharacterized protein n=1 Tax=Fusarium equiseti TaxID=61235 RepID=A0ABQ8R3S8_FUSEQ|nr:hypothetical protein NW768_009016 [Fusarium equiseti]